MGLDEKTEVQILKDMDEIYTNLDESLAEINMILGSRFVKPLREVAEKWKKDILYMSDMVDEWVTCQRNWRYLQNIFKAKDINASMPEESKMFANVDKQYKALMIKTSKNPVCIKIARQANVNTLLNLTNYNKDLDRVQKGLDDYMELKRGAFPRFYFLSPDELIDILANAQVIEIIQGHLKTCFDNIVNLEMGDDGIEILGMNSNEKENVKFKKPRNARGNIELWLLSVQEEMIATLKFLLNTANKEYPNMERKKFVLEKKGQIVATGA